MQKIVNSGKNAMAKILEGVDLVANPIISTISPKGRLVIMSQSYVADYGVHNLPVFISKDGYRVSKSITSPDAEVQVGVKLIQSACEKQMLDAGDATSTTALFTQYLLRGGLKLIEDGCSHTEVVAGIQSAIEYVVGELKKIAIPINGDVEKIRQVATVCSNNDSFIGDLIAQAFQKIGDNGVIQIEENKGRETTIKITDGIKFGRGWVSPYFITNKTKGEAELLEPYILIYDRPITMLNDTQHGTGILPLITEISKTGKRPLVIFCDDCDGEALATLTFNTQQNNFQSCVVSMAFLGQHKRDFMEDIAAATGGTYINELKGTKLENVTIKMLGQAQKVVVGKEDTIITGGVKDEKIFNTLNGSLILLENEQQDTELKELLKKRIARLNGSVAILSIGAMTEVEMNEKKDRADDAVRATRSSIEMGFVCGGGTPLLNIAFPKVGKELMKGYKLVFDCLKKPLEQICINAVKDFNTIYTNVTTAPKDYGYNAKADKVEDLIAAGIIEPVKSNICALQNSSSVVCTILQSEYLITDTL